MSAKKALEEIKLKSVLKEAANLVFENGSLSVGQSEFDQEVILSTALRSHTRLKDAIQDKIDGLKIEKRNLVKSMAMEYDKAKIDQAVMKINAIGIDIMKEEMRLKVALNDDAIYENSVSE